ncbi:MAG: hypothetical protein A3F68_09530 [Acidobacteria bacterium RIFCSPLOWO2_12_FULL_54_10]|nr:MAG: hypothetical protein A3F68_09530 [Acidobacteria bacterium RIFCSPLOWO2_12_FULL_54_10]
MKKSLWSVLLFLLGMGLPAQAQQFTDLILHNGKILTVDDDSFNTSLGTIAQAMHVKDGKVLHVGNNAQIRAMAGANTKVMDLKGRTVMPGIIVTHDHPFDWDPVNPLIVKKAIPESAVITRVLTGSPQENLLEFPKVLDEAISKAKPGQWIYIIFTLGNQYQYSMGGNGGYGRAGLNPDLFNILDGQHITKQTLDAAAPNNPVVLRDVFVASQLNQRAVDKVREVWKSFPSYLPDCVSDETGMGVRNPGCELNMRMLFSEVLMKEFYGYQKEVIRLGLEWWAGYGTTTFGSYCYNPTCVKVYDDLDRSGQMAIRQHWGWGWMDRILLPELFLKNFVNAMTNRGSDYFWFGGFSNGGGDDGGACTTAARIDPNVPERPCQLAPGSEGYKVLYEYIKNGGRYAAHTVADKDIDNLMDIIEKASLEGGMTVDQIRAKRHGFDHGVMSPRPDQIDRIKKLGLIASGNAPEIWQASPAIMQYYGERAAGWVVPKKRLNDAGVINTFEYDRAIGTTDFTAFTLLSWLITRKAWDGKVYAADQKTNRELALKSATTWGSYYVLREDVLGSLEPGKWADFVVLDRDYMAIPEDDIENIRALMTVVGGRVVHLVPSLARELGMQPAGAQVTLGFTPSKW